MLYICVDVAEEILNRCTELDPECYVYKEKFKVIFSYEFIEDAQTQIESLTVENPCVITGDIANRYSFFACMYRVYANRTQAKKIIMILILARFSGKGRHTLH